MDYQYHSQHQAEAFARQIIPVPENYPLKSGLPDDFPARFAALRELAKEIYHDMAKFPEAYGLMLLDIQSGDHNAARDSYRTVHRFVDTLSALSAAGEMKDHVLCVDAGQFRAAAKPVPRYGLILSKLRDFGFVIGGFDGVSIGKKVDTFTIEYPDNPDMVGTIKAYCDCWDALKGDRREVKLLPNEFHHHFYRFDYKITADMAKISLAQWVLDEADYSGFTPETKAFALAFYRESLRYKDIKFDGEYHYKGKRIARITPIGYAALGDPKYRLSIKLKDMDRYMDFIQTLPGTLTAPMKRSSCNHCNFQGATEEHCKFRLHWSMDGIKHTGCAHACFFFNDWNLDRVPDCWKLLELEYGLQLAIGI